MATKKKVDNESLLISPNPDITDLRKAAVGILTDEEKTPHIATKLDVAWFWKDMNQYPEVELAGSYIDMHLEELNTQYCFKLTEWMLEWYRFMPDALQFKLDRTGPVDWNLFCSLAFPLPETLPVPFHCFIRKLNVVQRGIVREQIYEECYTNRKLRNRVLKGEVIPARYTTYAAYSRIRKEVIKKMKKNGDVVPEDFKSKEQIFSETKRYIN